MRSYGTAVLVPQKGQSASQQRAHLARQLLHDSTPGGGAPRLWRTDRGLRTPRLPRATPSLASQAPSSPCSGCWRPGPVGPFTCAAGWQGDESVGHGRREGDWAYLFAFRPAQGDVWQLAVAPDPGERQAWRCCTTASTHARVTQDPSSIPNRAAGVRPPVAPPPPRSYRLVLPEELLTAVSARRRGQRFPVALTFDDDTQAARRLRNADPPGCRRTRHVLPVWSEPGRPQERLVGTAAACGAAGPTSSEPRRCRTKSKHQKPSAIDIQVLGQAVEALAPNREGISVSERLLEQAGPDPIDAGLPARRDNPASHPPTSNRLSTLGITARSPLWTVHQLRDTPWRTATRLFHCSRESALAIAYPHGRADARVANAARRAGFESGSPERLLRPRRPAIRSSWAAAAPSGLVTPSESLHLLSLGPVRGLVWK